MRRHGFGFVFVWFFLEEEDERIFEVLLLLIGDWDGGWDCVGERDLKSVASLVFYIYLTYLTYFDLTLPSLLTTTTTYNRYVSTHRFQNISFPLSHFPKLEELAWHGMLATAQVSLGGVAASETRVARPIAVAVPVSLLVVGTRKRASDHGETCQSVGRRACVDPRPSELRNSIAYLKAKGCD